MICSQLTRGESIGLYAEAIKAKDSKALRILCQQDLFFLLFIACNRRDINHDWLFARCREVESSPDENLDLWSREHYKSTIITFGKTIQDILNNPEETISIFSHTRPIAKSFLSQIKREFENNTFLQDLFPDILFRNPEKESPRWSLDDGIIVRRRSNPKESTIEAWGLVDGQPTSKHFSKLIYDDVVTRESVTSPEMITKVTDSFSLSLNLAGEPCGKRFVGTRYHAHDTYKTIIDRGIARVRLYPATDDGTFKGKAVFWSQEKFDKKAKDMGSYVASAQLLQNPLADNVMGFKDDWLMYYSSLNPVMPINYYILIDPASSKAKKSDYTVMCVIGLCADQNYYLVDGVRDRLNLTERTNKLFEFHKKWKPMGVGYEQYGMQADIEHIKYVQEHLGYRFHITSLGGQVPKNDRIRRLVPVFETHRFYLPYRLLFTTTEGKVMDFVHLMKTEEYEVFPVGAHDDIMDCEARVLEEDLYAMFPKELAPGNNGKQEFADQPSGNKEHAQGSSYNPFA